MTVTTTPTVLTVLLNFRTAEMTIQALEAVLREMDGIDGAITVVDNDSGDGSFEKLHDTVQAKGWERVRVLQAGRNGGYGAGNNFGMNQKLPDGSNPDFVYLLNSDAFPEPGSLLVLLNYIRLHPRVGFAGGRIHGEDGELHRSAFRFHTIFSEFETAAATGPISRLLKRHIVALPAPEESQEVDWLAGASLLIRRQTLDEVGQFDERFFLYFEETDLCLRAQRAGWSSVYVPQSRVMHIGSVSTGMKTWRRMPSYWFDSRLRYFMKNHGVLYAATATTAYLAGALILRTRWLLSAQGRPSGAPEHFLRDLLSHDFPRLWKRHKLESQTPTPT
jgi:N-acetylglucosaminyl-diphospho-decaprenol L-rhamnosyltransferase